MPCGGCNRNKNRSLSGDKQYTVMGGYKYLSKTQIDKRLNVFKRRYCGDCNDRYKCDYEMYLKCDKVDKGGE